MAEYRISSYDMKRQLMDLWLSCFEDLPKAVECFFEMRYKPENCVVCIEDNTVIAAIHMLPAKICINGQSFDACYHYAVSTKNEYRNRGYMNQLSRFADKVAAKKGQKFAFLLPASDSLYNYYEKSGYKTCFKIRVVELTQEQMKSYISNSGCNSNIFPSNSMYKLRKKIYNNIQMFVCWEEDAIKYASTLNSIYGGRTIFSGNSYAICSRPQNGTVEITEIVCEKENLISLLTRIYSEYPDMNYRFRLPVSQQIFKEQGQILNFGMIKPLGEQSLDIIGSPDGYIGLTLD